MKERQIVRRGEVRERLGTSEQSQRSDRPSLPSLVGCWSPFCHARHCSRQDLESRKLGHGARWTMTLHTSLDAYLELCELRSGAARLLAIWCVGEEGEVWPAAAVLLQNC